MIHIFDVDNTIVRRTSMLYFLQDAINKGIIRFSQIKRLPFDFLRYKLGIPDMDFIEEAVKKLSGICKNDLEKIAELSFNNRIKKNIYRGAAGLIKDLLLKNERVIFATSSIDIVIKPLETFLGTEKSLATEMEFKDGKSTGFLTGYSFFGAKKREAVKAWIEKSNLKAEDICFYSDSYTDIPLLEISGCPVAVNPDNRLKRRAKKSGWKIIYFKELLV